MLPRGLGNKRRMRCALRVRRLDLNQRPPRAFHLGGRQVVKRGVCAKIGVQMAILPTRPWLSMARVLVVLLLLARGTLKSAEFFLCSPLHGIGVGRGEKNGTSIYTSSSLWIDISRKYKV